MKRIAVFVVVGSAAALTHLVVVALLVRELALAPLVANLPAFLTAFGVSFLGHLRGSFRDHDASWRRALPRFFAVAVLGFALNEAIYAALLAWFGRAHYVVALILTLVAVACVTYVLSRRWAFAARGLAP